MDEHLSKAEIRKDALQEGAQAASQLVGTVAGIVTNAVGDIVSAVGGFATEVFEIRDSMQRAEEAAQEEAQTEPPEDEPPSLAAAPEKPSA